MSALPQLAQIKDKQEIESVVNHSVVSVNPQFIFKILNIKSEMMTEGMCKFDEEFGTLYPIFRGLSEAGRPTSLSFKFVPREKAAYFHYAEKNQKEVIKFFMELNKLLQNEVRFKQLLKEVIMNRNRFRAEQFLLQHALMGTVVN